MAFPEPIPFEPSLPTDADGGLPVPQKPVTQTKEPPRDISALIDELHATARESRIKIEFMNRGNQTLAAQLETTKAELENARAREVELRSRFTEITSLIKERDAALAANEGHLRTIAGLRSQLEAAAKKPATVAVEAVSPDASRVQAQLLSIRQARDAAQSNVTDLTLKLAKAEDQIAELGYARESEQQAQKALAKELGELRRTMEKLTAERHQQTAEDEKTRTLEMELASAHQHEAELEENQKEQSVQVRNLSKRAEEHRKLAIDLAAQLDASRRELVQMTANLAEARLQTKFAKSAQTAGTSAEPSIPVAAPEGPLDLKSQEPLKVKDARNLLKSMAACLESFSQNPASLELLDDLFGHAQSFSERSRIAGMLALYRLSFAFASLTRHLIEIPDALNPSTLHTMKQTIEFLLTLVRDRNLTALKDPAKAQVYAVDDETENCELMAMGLAMVMLPLAYGADAISALGDLASGAYDLIFLDVNLPGMDGFALCTEIRCLPGYEQTPIVFLTGFDTAENRLQSVTSGGSDFISKPFNLHELNVKSLTLILQAQLGTE